MSARILSSDTIFALATPAGRSGVAVFRLSGPAAGDALRALGLSELPAPREAGLVTLTHPETGETIDRGLALWFPGPASFTGEDVAELQVHGSLAVIHELTETLASLPGLRMAEPGEFARRAFASGKMDLTAAEGLADLIDAETAAQKKQAQRQMGGAMAALYNDWRERIITLLALTEAYIDFPDEDIPGQVVADRQQKTAGLIAALDRYLNDAHRGERIRSGITGVILGPPNAGKSSLLNALAKREIAIVSETAGTTRDVIEVHLDIAGLPVTLADTAGLRDSTDAIEQEGVRRALARAQEADFRLLLLDAVSPEAGKHYGSVIQQGNTFVIVNKTDLFSGFSLREIEGKIPLPLSVKTGEGMGPLMQTLTDFIQSHFALSDGPVITRTRHRLLLTRCRDSLTASTQDLPIELTAEELRRAADALGQLTGAIGVEDILDQIFSSFCIGK